MKTTLNRRTTPIIMITLNMKNSTMQTNSKMKRNLDELKLKMPNQRNKVKAPKLDL